MHLVYGFSNGNAVAAVEKFQTRFPDRRFHSSGVLTRINWTLHYMFCLPSVAFRSEMEMVRTINTRGNIIEMVQ